MGDRVYVQIECSRAALEAVLAAMNPPKTIENVGASDECEENGIVTLGFEEVNYADIKDCTDFPMQCPFIATHNAGGGYSGAEIVNDGKETDYASQDQEGQYSFAVDPETGEPKVDDSWRAFWAMRKRVRAMIDLAAQQPKVATD